MTYCIVLLQMLANIDSTPPLEPPMPGKLIPAVAAADAANGNGRRPSHAAGEVLKEMEQKHGQEVKTSMQSHFD